VRIGVLFAFCVLIAGGAGAAEASRIEARSSDLIVVGLLQGDTMTIHVSRVLDNAPVRDARLEVAFRGGTYPTVAQVDGGYTFQARELTLPGAVAMEFHIVTGGSDEKLGGMLQVAAATGKAGEGSSARQYLWWVLNFAVCGAFLVLWARRKKRAES
jgi:hypothetical protein